MARRFQKWTPVEPWRRRTRCRLHARCVRWARPLVKAVARRVYLFVKRSSSLTWPVHEPRSFQESSLPPNLIVPFLSDPNGAARPHDKRVLVFSAAGRRPFSLSLPPTKRDTLPKRLNPANRLSCYRPTARGLTSS